MPPEVLEQQAPAEAPSLRDTLAAAIEANPIEAPAPDRETPQQSQNNPAESLRQSVERARGPDGKFAPRQATPKNDSQFPTQDEVKAATEPVVPDADEQQPQQQEAVANTDNAPKSWKAGAKEKWASVDPDIRAEVHRREREMTRAISEAAPIRKFTSEFTQIIQPHAARYAPTGMQPLQVISNLLNADALLSTAPQANKAMFMAKLIHDYGIDIATLDAALSGDDPSREPQSQLESLIDQKLKPLQEFVQTAQQRRQQAQQQEYSQQAQHIQSMVQDDINYPHMQLVAAEMADLMEVAARRRVYMTPEEAYKRAVAMNPEAQAAEQGRAGQQRARAAHDVATRSLGASLSVSGSSAGLKQTVAPDDLRGTIEAAWAAANGR